MTPLARLARPPAGTHRPSQQRAGAGPLHSPGHEAGELRPLDMRPRRLAAKASLPHRHSSSRLRARTTKMHTRDASTTDAQRLTRSPHPAVGMWGRCCAPLPPPPKLRN
eukprot:366347-Chlamydomonas_euryale.AAC.6